MTLPSRVTLRPRGPFSLDPLRTLACGFLRGTRACAADGSVELAFPREDTFEPVAVRVVESGLDVVLEAADGQLGEVLTTQVARSLSLDRDGGAYASLVEQHPVLRTISAVRPGFRPVVATSPYAMAGWCVLSQRTPMDRAVATQTAMARAFGDLASSARPGGAPLPSFPRPESILARRSFPGLTEEKWRRLQAVASAALDGKLQANELLALPYEEAQARLRTIRGVGTWTADAILVRGCGATDLLPLGEPTLHTAVADAYGLANVPSDEAVIRLAAAWRPFRIWVSVLLIAHGFRQSSGKRGRRGAVAA